MKLYRVKTEHKIETQWNILRIPRAKQNSVAYFLGTKTANIQHTNKVRRCL